MQNIIMFSLFLCVLNKVSAQRTIDEFNSDFNIDLCLHVLLFRTIEIPQPIHYNNFYSKYAKDNRILSYEQVEHLVTGYIKTFTEFDKQGYMLKRKTDHVFLKPGVSFKRTLSANKRIDNNKYNVIQYLEKYYYNGNSVTIQFDSIVNKDTIAYKQIYCHFTQHFKVDTIFSRRTDIADSEITIYSIDTFQNKIDLSYYYKHNDKVKSGKRSHYYEGTNVTTIYPTRFNYRYPIATDDPKEKFLEKTAGKYKSLIYFTEDQGLSYSIFLNEHNIYYTDNVLVESMPIADRRQQCKTGNEFYYSWNDENILNEMIYNTSHTKGLCRPIYKRFSIPGYIKLLQDNTYQVFGLQRSINSGISSTAYLNKIMNVTKYKS